MFRMFPQKLILFVLGLVAFYICSLMIGEIAWAQTTDNARNMRGLLENWKTMSETEVIIVAFQLTMPLTQGGDTWIEVPSSNPGMDFHRNWGDIGDDYICFDERGGQAYVTRCTPFTNIAEVSYVPPL